MTSADTGPSPKRFWLFKTEPVQYSFQRLLSQGRTMWDGVANPLARRHLRAIQPGDPILIYHTGKEKAIVGLAKAVGHAYPNPGKTDPDFTVIDIVPERALRYPVTLLRLKKHKEFAEFPLVKMPRLSVMPVPEGLWRRIIGMSEGIPERYP